MANILEMANSIVKQSEMWKSGVLVEYIGCTFHLIKFKVLLGVIRCTCIFSENTVFAILLFLQL